MDTELFKYIVLLLLALVVSYESHDHHNHGYRNSACRSHECIDLCCSILADKASIPCTLVVCIDCKRSKHAK